MAWNDTSDSQDVYKGCIVAVVAGGVKKKIGCVNREPCCVNTHPTHNVGVSACLRQLSSCKGLFRLHAQHAITVHAARFTQHILHLKLTVLIQQHTIHHNLTVVPHVTDKVPVNSRVILATGLRVAGA